MTTEVLALALSAGVQATFGQGRVFYIKTAAAPITLIAEKMGSGASVIRFVNMGAGTKFTAKPGQEWDYLRVVSATSQNIELIVGDDDVDIANAVSVSGVALVQQAPATGIAVSASDTAINNASFATIAANLSRKSLTIGALASNTGNLRVQSAGAGSTKGRELQPGTTVTYVNTGAFDVRNDSGATQSIWIEEET